MEGESFTENGYHAWFPFPSKFNYVHPSAAGKLIRSAPDSALLGIRRPLI